MRVGSLFTGIGGFDLGLEGAGMDCVWQVEIDKHCNTVLRQHWLEVKRYGDIKEIHRGELERVDLICGGFPCQDLSVAGKRSGLAGERSGLFFEFMRIVAELSPRWILIENVPGLLSSNKRRDMGTLLWEVGKLGYGWAYRVLDAQYFGVAQRRRRVFIVGYLGDGRSAAEVLFEPESVCRDSPPSRETGAKVAASVKASSPSRRNCGSWPIVEELVATTLSSGSNPNSNAPGRRREDDVNLVAHALTGKGRLDPNGQDFMVSCPLRSQAQASHREDSETYIPVALTPGDRGISPDQAAAGMLQVEGTTVRRLTPTECERLQGFPDGWTAECSDSARYRMLGNAVAVPVAEWIGKRIIEGNKEAEEL